MPAFLPTSRLSLLTLAFETEVPLYSLGQSLLSTYSLPVSVLGPEDTAPAIPELSGPTTRLLWYRVNAVIKGKPRGLWDIRRGPESGLEVSGRLLGRSGF